MGKCQKLKLTSAVNNSQVNSRNQSFQSSYDLHLNQSPRDFNRNREITFAESYVSPAQSRIKFLKSEKNSPVQIKQKIYKHDEILRNNNFQSHPDSTQLDFQHMKKIKFKKFLNDSFEKQDWSKREIDQQMYNMKSNQQSQAKHLNIQHECSPKSPKSATIVHYSQKQQFSQLSRQIKTKYEEIDEIPKLNELSSSAKFSSFTQRANNVSNKKQEYKDTTEQYILGKSKSPRIQKISNEFQHSPNMFLDKIKLKEDKKDLFQSPNTHMQHKEEIFKEQSPSFKLKHPKQIKLNERYNEAQNKKQIKLMNTTNLDLKPLNEYYLKVLNNKTKNENQESMMDRFFKQEMQNFTGELRRKIVQYLAIKITLKENKKGNI